MNSITYMLNPLTTEKGMRATVEEGDRGPADQEGRMPQPAPRAKEGKIADFHFLELRHPCATRMVRGGVGLYKAQRLLEHPSLIMAQHYAHHEPESLREGVEILERYRVASTKSTNLAQAAGVALATNGVSG